jgi:hypothetical protein
MKRKLKREVSKEKEIGREGKRKNGLKKEAGGKKWKNAPLRKEIMQQNYCSVMSHVSSIFDSLSLKAERIGWAEDIARMGRIENVFF